MEPNIEHTDEAQKPDNPIERHAISPSDILFAFLTEGEVAADSLHVLAQICTDPYALVAIKPASQRGFVTLQNIISLAKNAHICSVEAQLENILVMLLSNEDVLHLTQAIKEKGMASKVSMAISLPFTSLNGIPMQHELLTYTLNSTGDSGVIEAKGNAFEFLTSKIKTEIDAKTLLHPAIAVLAQYDRTNQSNLLETLRVYLENDRNAQHSANLLYLHRNSLQYRVHRIQDIAGINLDDAAERAYLRLSFMLADL